MTKQNVVVTKNGRVMRIGQDKLVATSLYVATNISAYDKIKTGNTLRQNKNKSRHKILSQHRKAKRLCRNREILCHNNHNMVRR